ncbi:hypothetical protein QBC39DRAFT_373498 [Podospora conica]|nr:hypothetical protein QBC39DRAFT_373498 [Schizothecium conicum]
MDVPESNTEGVLPVDGMNPESSAQLSNSVAPATASSCTSGVITTNPFTPSITANTTSLLPRTPQTRPLGIFAKLPVEIFLEIAWALPDHVRCEDDCTCGSRIPPRSPPRPRALFALARTCKGFWNCLKPLLFEADVICETMCMDLEPDRRWYIRDYISTLAWSIMHGYTSTAETAIETARSMGVLYKYASSLWEYQGASPYLGYPWEDRWVDPEEVYVDPLSIAILKGNFRVVELLTIGMSARQLSGEWPEARMLSSWKLRITATPLNIAIWMGQYDIVKLLLQRFCELDQETLQWNEPLGLQLACFLGDVGMVRLMLDGEQGAEPASPWVSRMRAQLHDPRAYDGPPAFNDTSSPRYNYLYDHYHLDHTPPMVLATAGLVYECWRPDGALIFALLAERGPADIVTRPFNHYKSLVEPAWRVTYGWVQLRFFNSLVFNWNREASLQGPWTTASQSSARGAIMPPPTTPSERLD